MKNKTCDGLCSCPRCEPAPGVNLELLEAPACPAAPGSFVWLRESGAAPKAALARSRLLSEKRTFGPLERQHVPSSSRGTGTFKGRIATLLSAERKAQRCTPSHHPKSPWTDLNPLVLGSQSTSPGITGNSFRKSSRKNRACCTEIVRSL